MEKLFLNFIGRALGRNIIVGIILILFSSNIGLAIYIAKQDDRNRLDTAKLHEEHRLSIQALNAFWLARESVSTQRFEDDLKRQIELAKEAIIRQEKQIERFSSIKYNRK